MAYDSMFDELPRGPVSEAIIQRITEALVDGRLKPGDKLPTEMEFSEKLGVGRNSVREAIKVLVAFGVLEIRRADGTFVVEEFSHKLLDPMVYGLILVRRSKEQLLEFKLANLNAVLWAAIKRMTPEKVSHLRQLIEHVREGFSQDDIDRDKLYMTTVEFYEYLGIASENPMLIQLNEVVLRLSHNSRNMAVNAAMDCPNLDRFVLVELYSDIVDVLESGDGNAIPALIDRVDEAWQKLVPFEV